MHIFADLNALIVKQIPAITAALSGNFVLVALIAGVLFGLTFIRGKGFGVALLAGFYPANLLYIIFPYDLSLIAGNLSEKTTSIILFGILWAASSYVLEKIVAPDYSSSPVKRWMDGVIVAIFGSAYVVSFLNVNLGGHAVDLGQGMALFTSSTLFWWALVPLVGIFLLARR